MNTYVALIADASGRYCHVYGTANTWPNYIDQLEEHWLRGCRKSNRRL
jgi:hypothetical protein